MDLMINVLQTDRWVVSTGGRGVEGGGVDILSHMGYEGMCHCEVYGFQAVYSGITGFRCHTIQNTCRSK